MREGATNLGEQTGREVALAGVPGSPVGFFQKTRILYDVLQLLLLPGTLPKIDFRT